MEKGKTECFIFDFQGKFIERTFLPVKNMDAVDFSPLTIKNNKIYQLVENEESENWELHINGIK